jgi:hypothetical protein
MQEYRYQILISVSKFFEIFGVRRPIRYEPVPISAGDYDDAVHSDHPEAPSFLEPYLNTEPKPQEPSENNPEETPPAKE